MKTRPEGEGQGQQAGRSFGLIAAPAIRNLESYPPLVSAGGENEVKFFRRVVRKQAGSKNFWHYALVVRLGAGAEAHPTRSMIYLGYPLVGLAGHIQQAAGGDDLPVAGGEFHPHPAFLVVG